MPPAPFLRPACSRLFPNSLLVAMAVYTALNLPRFYGYLRADGFQPFPVLASTVAMGLIPLALLDSEGRRRIGLAIPSGRLWPLVTIASGLSASALCAWLGGALFGYSEAHWFVSIGYSYLDTAFIAYLPQSVAFIAFTAPTMLLIPVGQELLYRGLLHEAARERWSWPKAATCNAALFALAQLAQHGLYRTPAGWQTHALSVALWLGLMFGFGLWLSFLRQRYLSIWTSIACHSFFILGMNYAIFYGVFVEP